MTAMYMYICYMYMYIDTTLDLSQSYGPNSRCFETTPDGTCNHVPACYKTTVYRYTGTGDLAYKITNHTGMYMNMCYAIYCVYR